jgi:deoxyribodipyrimidine photo-lyase
MTENFIKHMLRWRTMTAFRADIAKDQVQEPCDMSAITTMQSPSLFQREMQGNQNYLFKMDSAVEHGHKETTEMHGIFADEDESLKRLHYILTKPGFMEGYRESRMLASTGDNSSMLSTALSVGSLSPRMVYTKVMASLNAKRAGTGGCDWSEELQKNGPGEAWLIMHLVIRDFFIFSSECHGPELLVPDGPAKKSIAWKRDEELFKAWTQGRTGFPYVDANMRQLATTGYISNRGRQNVASFLAKELEIDWRWGAQHFQSTLVDHEAGINLESWAYVSGVGSDPRDRKFLSVTQGERYDPQGTLIARWLPELAQLPAPYMHRPWSYPDKGKLNYPEPIVDPANQIGRHV